MHHPRAASRVAHPGVPTRLTDPALLVRRLVVDLVRVAEGTCRR